MNIQQFPDRFTLQSIFEGLEDAIVCYDLDMLITNWSPSAERMFGYAPDEIIGKSIYQLIPAEKRVESQDTMQNILLGKRISHLKTTRVTKSGDVLPVSLSISPIKEEDQTIIGFTKIIRNIVGEQIAEEKQATLAAIIESSEDAIISKTLNGVITTWNKGAEQIFGYTEQEAIGQHISLLLPKDRLAEEDIIIESLRRGEKVDHFQTVRVTKDGRQLHISLTVSPIRNGSGVVIGASKIARNITPQKEADQAIAKNLERLEIMNVVGKSINESLDLQHILQKVTDAATKLTGAEFGAFFYNRINQEGESYWLYTISGVPREMFENFPMPRNTAVFHPTFSGEGVVRVDDINEDQRYGKNPPYYGKPEGHLPVTSYLAVPVVSNSGTVIGGLFLGHQEKGVFKAEHEDLIVTVASQAAVAIDNSKLFQEVQELSNKKDEFIALATHELKTPLTSMNGFLQIVQRSIPEGVGKSFIEKAVKQLNKLNLLVNDLFDISKIRAGKLQLEIETFLLSDLFRDVEEAFRQSHKDYFLEIKLETDLTVQADKMRLEQILTNLVNNAVKYAPQSPTIILKAIRINDQIQISVTDFGPGIKPEDQEQIFSQFYRVEEKETKTSGLGLGLFICRDIVERHGGRIWVESAQGQGTTFTFTLPEQN